MTKKLVSRPNLDHLRQQAKELLADLKSGNSAAISTIRENLPTATDMLDAEVLNAKFRLADAQYAIARKTGFGSWPKLAAHIETLRALEGTWGFESLEVGGQQFSKEMLSTSRILMDGDRFRSESAGSIYEGIFLIDVEPRVHTIDIQFVEGPEAGNTNFGIFKLNADRLEICLDIYGKDRPKKFATVAGTGQAYESLVRQTADRPANVHGGTAPNNLDSNCSVPTEEEFSFADSNTMRRIQGDWKAVLLVSDGCPVPKSMVTSGKRTANQNRIVVRFGGQTMIDALFRIDESKTPIAVDYLHMSGGMKGKLQFGVLSWEGNTLIVNMASPGKSRPTDFQSKVGSMQTVSHWQLES